MRRITSWLSAVAGIGMVSLVGTAVSAQQPTTTTELKQFEIVSVDGNKVVVKGDRGAQEITVPDDFRLTVDGRPVAVNELKPGMKGTATITTTTTVTPVHVTEIRNGEVMQKVGNSIVVKTDKGMQMFSEGDATKRAVKVMRGGQPIPFTDLRQGDRLTATIVTERPPKVVTQRQVEAAMSSPAPQPAAPAAQPAPAGAQEPAAPPAARRLPKTASPLPLVGIVGTASLIGALIMAARRRRNRS